jgi:hypothetical protein
MDNLKRAVIIGLALLFALAILSPAIAIGEGAVQADAIITAPSAVDTFFSSEFGQILLTAIGGVASAGFLALTGSEFYKSRTNFVTRRIAEFFAAAVAQTYATKVREWKAKSPTGSLTEAQKREAESAAMSLAKSAAEDAGLGNHPMVKDAAMLRGAIVNAVADAKRGVLRKSQLHTAPSTKGA